MLADAMVRMSRRPDRRYAIDPAQFELQFGKNLDPVSRAVHLLLRSQMAHMGLPLVGYDQGTPMARVQQGDVSAAPEMINRMLQLLGGQAHRADAQQGGQSTPKDEYANNLETSQYQRPIMQRLLGNVGDMMSGGEKHPMVRQFLPGTPEYRNAGRSRMPPGHIHPAMELLRLIHGIHGPEAADTLSRHLAGGLAENDLQHQTQGRELLEHLTQSTPPDQRSIPHHNLVGMMLQDGIRGNLINRRAI
jgi:hypothetical protein